MSGFGYRNFRGPLGLFATTCCGILLAAALAPPAEARTTQDFLDSADQHIKKGEVQAAVIELRNAERDAPQDPTIHVRLAAMYLRLGNYPDADREAKAAAKTGAEEAQYLPIQMDILLREHKLAELLDAVPAGSRTPTLESEVRIARGMALAGSHDNAAAVTSLREAVELDPASPRAKIVLAQQLIATKAIDDADPIVEDVLSKYPASASAHREKAQILEVRGDFDGALKEFNQALELEPRNVPAQLGRAQLYLERGADADADKDLDPILSLNPNNLQANYLRATELFRQNKPGAADSILTKVSSSFPDFPDGYLLLAKIQYSQGKLQLSEDSLNKYIARVPDSVQGVRLLAAIAIKKGEFSRAVDDLQPLVAKQPNDLLTRSLLGKAYLGNGKPDLALEQYQAAAELHPDDPTAKTQLALSEVSAGHKEQGIELLEDAFKSETGAPIAGPVLVLAELRAGQISKAADVARALVAKDSNNPLYQNLLGLTQFSQRDYRAAEATLTALVAQKPDFFPARQNLAQVYIATGQPEKAKKVYEDYVARTPGDVRALLALTDLAMADRDWKAAIGFTKQASSASAGDPTPQIKLIDIYITQKDYENAQAAAVALLGSFPANHDVLDAEGRVQLSSGDFAGATATYHRLHDAVPTSTTFRSRYLAALRGTKDWTTARDMLAQTLVREPNNIAVKVDLIRIESEIGGIDAGLAKAREFAANDPNNPNYDLISAELYDTAGRLPDAISLLERAGKQHTSESVILALSSLYVRNNEAEKAEALLSARLEKEPSDIDARDALASEYLHQQKLDLARQQFERVAADAPNSFVALNNLAWIYQQQGDLSKAREMAERAIALAPRNPAIADTLGWVLVAQGDNNNALKYLKSAADKTPNPDIQYHLAVALQRAGDSSEARELLESILKAPNSFQSKPDAQKLLDQIKKG